MTDTGSRPSASQILHTPVHLIAFGFGTGLAPFAPGTFGTLVGIPFFLVLVWLPPQTYLLAVALLFVIGCWICGESARRLGVHDHGGIVFDEIVGYLLAAAPLLWTPPQGAGHWAMALAAAFVAFRFFDIVKPWPIRVLDRRVPGGFGIMLDDLAAGAMSAALLWAGLLGPARWLGWT